MHLRRLDVINWIIVHGWKEIVCVCHKGNRTCLSSTWPNCCKALIVCYLEHKLIKCWLNLLHCPAVCVVWYCFPEKRFCCWQPYDSVWHDWRGGILDMSRMSRCMETISFHSMYVHVCKCDCLTVCIFSQKLDTRVNGDGNISDGSGYSELERYSWRGY